MTSVTKLFGEEQIQSRIREVGAAIRRDAGDSEVFLIGILKGSSVFLADLIRAIPGQVHYEWVNVLFDVADTETAEATEIDFLTQFSMQGRHIYVLKDIVTSGIIENYLLTQFRERDPASLHLVAMIDCPGSRTVDLACQSALFTTERGRFVGYGLEFENRFANLPYIATLA
ncbi:MAG: phosphoribosyltransferase [Thermoanaerobaculia bacterium]